MSERTIFRLLGRMRATGTVDDRPRSGRPRLTTCHQDRYITLNDLRNRFLSAASGTARNTPGHDHPHISADTVRRRLRAAGLCARRPYQGSRLTERHCRLRLTWAQQHLHWIRRQWRDILFTDKSRFVADGDDGRAPSVQKKG